MRKLIIAMVFIIVLVSSGCVKKAEPIVPPSKENPTESPSKADPIALPSINEIISVEITTGIEDIIHKDEAWIKSFIQKVSEATPTSKESVQDVPTVSKYTRVDIVGDKKISSIFIYEENSEYYIEQAYKGIYKTDETILDFLKSDKQ
ncbi:MAG TPA: hypothetical protein DEF04_09290 [Clostridiales bacterium]|nr:hypothetical protein [Clostridiales bacterium]